MTENINSDTFASQWDATDIAHLQPGHLARAKPMRAWERKPASPFTKQRLRVGKVWKRALPAARAKPSDATGDTEQRTIKRLKEGQSTQSPLKIVKRLCLGPNSGIGLQWDKIESPEKRITTRSAASNDLVALSEEEDDASSGDEEEDVEGTVIEYLDEDGSILPQSADKAQDEEGWSDVDAPASDADEPHDDTMIRFGGAVEDATIDHESCENENQATLQVNHPLQENLDDENDAGSGSERAVETETQSGETMPSLGPANQSIALPAGFVSPVRRKRPAGRRISAFTGEAGRRRTLPRTFAISDTTEDQSRQAQNTVDAAQHSEEATTQNDPLATAEPTDMDEDEPITDQKFMEGEPSPADDDEWEDVANEAEVEERNSPRSNAQTIEEHQTVDDNNSTMQDTPTSPSTESLSHQLALPLRRSPRRKSSSPLKQRSFQAFADAAPHLVAFSPVKGASSVGNDISRSIDVDDAESVHSFTDGSPIMLERSASAPPEEPQMSPRRSARPRVSDDTALLQAFLNRAAENKSTRRLSATKRESLSNRRDSDTVRQALASPLKPEILGTLDPNSPSPKKSMPAPEEAKPASIDSMVLGSPVASAKDIENSQSRTTRRSHREKRRVERAEPLAHTRISLRGNTDPVVLKRSEAQELATLTRSNTRKNKGGSIMPPLRLSKLIVEKPPIEKAPEVADQSTASKPSRNVQWDETLVYYQEAPSEPEVQLFELGDSNTAPKLQGPPKVLAPEPEVEESVPAPPPAAETPSKPKVRKLRAPRTASTPAKPAPAPIAPNESVEPPKQRQPRRLKTPAKGQEDTSLPTADVAQVEQPTSAAKPTAVPRKRVASRLPAPASLPAAAHEPQSLISSPPKKKASSGGPPVKSSAPKLNFQTSLIASSRPADQASEPVGLMSPAKRAGKGVSFGNPLPAPSFGQKAEQPTKAPGLNSPAKKRTRRAL